MTGLHHVTAITRNVQANVDFWMGFLGLAVQLPVRLSFHPDVTRRVDIELRRAALPTGVPLPVETVLQTLAQRMPYLDRGALRARVGDPSTKRPGVIRRRLRRRC